MLSQKSNDDVFSFSLFDGKTLGTRKQEIVSMRSVLNNQVLVVAPSSRNILCLVTERFRNYGLNQNRNL
jgi:hypothetical protein